MPVFATRARTAPPLLAAASPHHPRSLHLHNRFSWGPLTRSSLAVAASTSTTPSLGHSRKHLVDTSTTNTDATKPSKTRVFLLDVNPLCFRGSRPSLRAFYRWAQLFFSDVSLRDPVIAVFDGEEGNEYRRRILPSYKAHRRRRYRRGCSADPRVVEVLRECNIPVVRVDSYEADDVVATLTDQALHKGYRVVIASPDKDFKQLISKDVQLVMPIPEIGRWSFYTLKHYFAQYKCDPTADLSLRCFMGDESDGVPGIQNLAPGFGLKTAVKLLKKHGSLENLLNAAAVRTVGKDYAQDTLTKHADYLRKNYEILSLRRDANIQLDDRWLSERDSSNDSIALSNFISRLDEGQRLRSRTKSGIM